LIPTPSPREDLEMRTVRTALLALLFVSAAPAQLVVGDVGVTSDFSFTQFAIVHADGTSSAFTATGLLGLPITLLHDPSQPNTFLISAAPFGFGGLSVAITDVPPGTIEGLTIGSFDVSLPLGAGPIFGFSPDAFSVRQLVMFPTPSSGNPNHWTWPVAASLFPASPVFVSPGILPSGTVLDLIGIGINGYPSLTPTPVVRLAIN
jgi:hypothetical protein